MTLLNVMMTEFVMTESRFLEKQRFITILIYSQRKKKKKKKKEFRGTRVIVCITLLNLPTKVLMDARDEIFSSISLFTNYNMSCY